MFYAGREFTATAQQGRRLPFVCSHCGYRTEAMVLGRGIGSGRSHFFIDQEGAADDAVMKATRAANQNAELTIRLASCPRCKLRDGAALMRFCIWTIVKTILIAALPITIGSCFAYLERGHPYGLMLTILVPAGLVIAGAAYYWLWHWQWTTVDDRVLFAPKKR